MSSCYSSCRRHSCGAHCPFPQWVQPILCNPTHYCHAGSDSGPTLVIHKIILTPGGGQSCTPRTFTLRITGPSYPCGETFTLRAGSCTELDEPLVIAGLEPGQYTIEELGSRWFSCDSTLTGPVCGNTVTITSSPVPTVVTIVSRQRLQCCGSCGRWHGQSCSHSCCGWHGQGGCHTCGSCSG
ncbi:MAG: hypothetical protein J6K32_09785 [Clostridia bacterium]|nr:hypothetical protein [Clostridia bacterium]